MNSKRVMACLKCKEFIPTDPGNPHSVMENIWFSNKHHNHSTVIISVKELDIRNYKRFIPFIQTKVV